MRSVRCDSQFVGSWSDRGFVGCGFAVRGFAIRGFAVRGSWVRCSWARGFAIRGFAVRGFDDLRLTISSVVQPSQLSGFAISLSLFVRESFLSLSFSLCASPEMI